MTRSVSRQGDVVTITMHVDDVHGLRVALRPVLAGETPSTSTQNIRDNLDKALARVQGSVKA